MERAGDRRVDDFVLLRNDGGASPTTSRWSSTTWTGGVDQVVRGDDLLSSSPRQAWLARRLGGESPRYAHVPLAVNRAGHRLAKRDGAVTLADLRAAGAGPAEVPGRIAVSLDLAETGEPITPAVALERFDPARLPRRPWVVT